MRLAESSQQPCCMGMAVRYTVHAEVSWASTNCLASSRWAWALQRLSCLDSRYVAGCQSRPESLILMPVLGMWPDGFTTDQRISIAATQSKNYLMAQSPGLLNFELHCHILDVLGHVNLKAGAEHLKFPHTSFHACSPAHILSSLRRVSCCDMSCATPA